MADMCGFYWLLVSVAFLAVFYPVYLIHTGAYPAFRLSLRFTIFAAFCKY